MRNLPRKTSVSLRGMYEDGSNYHIRFVQVAMAFCTRLDCMVRFNGLYGISNSCTSVLSSVSCVGFKSVDHSRYILEKAFAKPRVRALWIELKL